MTPTELKDAAITLYGSGMSDTRYIDLLAKDLRSPRETVKNWWYGKRRILGPIEVALELLIEQK